MTDRQRRFCDEYLIDLNGTRAYMAAYPSVKKETTAKAAASRLLTFVNVRNYIRERMKAQQERVEIEQDRILRELADIAFADITEIVSIKDGKVCIEDIDSLPPEKRAAIAEIKENQWGTEIKICDRLRALELLGKHLGMFGRVKDDLDLEEQQARVAKLQRGSNQTNESQEISVIILGADSDKLSEIMR